MQEKATEESFLSREYAEITQRSETMKKSTARLHSSAIILSAAVMLALFAILSFALPTVTYVSPTLSDNATTGSNWTYINITSSEDLNQSLLEWGNNSGFTNVSMSNLSASMQNWYVNMSDLADGTITTLSGQRIQRAGGIGRSGSI